MKFGGRKNRKKDWKDLADLELSDPNAFDSWDDLEQQPKETQPKTSATENLPSSSVAPYVEEMAKDECVKKREFKNPVEPSNIIDNQPRVAIITGPKAIVVSAPKRHTSFPFTSTPSLIRKKMPDFEVSSIISPIDISSGEGQPEEPPVVECDATLKVNRKSKVKDSDNFDQLLHSANKVGNQPVEVPLGARQLNNAKSKGDTTRQYAGGTLKNRRSCNTNLSDVMEDTENGWITTDETPTTTTAMRGLKTTTKHIEEGKGCLNENTKSTNVLKLLNDGKGNTLSIASDIEGIPMAKNKALKKDTLGKINLDLDSEELSNIQESKFAQCKQLKTYSTNSKSSSKIFKTDSAKSSSVVTSEKVTTGRFDKNSMTHRSKVLEGFKETKETREEEKACKSQQSTTIATEGCLLRETRSQKKGDTNEATMMPKKIISSRESKFIVGKKQNEVMPETSKSDPVDSELIKDNVDSSKNLQLHEKPALSDDNVNFKTEGKKKEAIEAKAEKKGPKHVNEKCIESKQLHVATERVQGKTQNINTVLASQHDKKQEEFCKSNKSHLLSNASGATIGQELVGNHKPYFQSNSNRVDVGHEETNNAQKCAEPSGNAVGMFCFSSNFSIKMGSHVINQASSFGVAVNLIRNKKSIAEENIQAVGVTEAATLNSQSASVEQQNSNKDNPKEPPNCTVTSQNCNGESKQTNPSENSCQNKNNLILSRNLPLNSGNVQELDSSSEEEQKLLRAQSLKMRQCHKQSLKSSLNKICRLSPAKQSAESIQKRLISAVPAVVKPLSSLKEHSSEGIEKNLLSAATAHVKLQSPPKTLQIEKNNCEKKSKPDENMLVNLDENNPKSPLLYSSVRDGGMSDGSSDQCVFMSRDPHEDCHGISEDFELEIASSSEDDEDIYVGCKKIRQPFKNDKQNKISKDITHKSHKNMDKSKLKHSKARNISVKLMKIRQRREEQLRHESSDDSSHFSLYSDDKEKGVECGVSKSKLKTKTKTEYNRKKLNYGSDDENLENEVQSHQEEFQADEFSKSEDPSGSPTKRKVVKKNSVTVKSHVAKGSKTKSHQAKIKSKISSENSSMKTEHNKKKLNHGSDDENVENEVQSHQEEVQADEFSRSEDPSGSPTKRKIANKNSVALKSPVAKESKTKSQQTKIKSKISSENSSMKTEHNKKKLNHGSDDENVENEVQSHQEEVQADEFSRSEDPSGSPTKRKIANKNSVALKSPVAKESKTKSQQTKIKSKMSLQNFIMKRSTVQHQKEMTNVKKISKTKGTKATYNLKVTEESKEHNHLQREDMEKQKIVANRAVAAMDLPISVPQTLENESKNSGFDNKNSISRVTEDSRILKLRKPDHLAEEDEVKERGLMKADVGKNYCYPKGRRQPLTCDDSKPPVPHETEEKNQSSRVLKRKCAPNLLEEVVESSGLRCSKRAHKPPRMFWQSLSKANENLWKNATEDNANDKGIISSPTHETDTDTGTDTFQQIPKRHKRKFVQSSKVKTKKRIKQTASESATSQKLDSPAYTEEDLKAYIFDADSGSKKSEVCNLSCEADQWQDKKCISSEGFTGNLITLGVGAKLEKLRAQKCKKLFYVLEGQVCYQLAEKETILRDGSFFIVPRDGVYHIRNMGSSLVKLVSVSCKA